MKKLISLLIALIICLSLAACGNTPVSANCTNCGVKVLNKALFCIECNSNLSSEETSSIADKCCVSGCANKKNCNSDKCCSEHVCAQNGCQNIKEKCSDFCKSHNCDRSNCKAERDNKNGRCAAHKRNKSNSSNPK